MLTVSRLTKRQMFHHKEMCTMSESFSAVEQEVDVGEHQCSFCEKSYKTAKSLRAHVKCHTGEGYQCRFCLMFCTAPSTLERHMKTHTEQQSCSCVVCDRQFVAPKNLKWHVRAVHGGDVNILMKSLGEQYGCIDLSSTFPCQFCEKSYAQIKSLKKHLISVHGYDGDHITVTASTTKSTAIGDGVNSSHNECFVFYPSKTAGPSPTENSTPEVLYTCELCPEDQLFPTLESVLAHMQVHQSETSENTTQNGQSTSHENQTIDNLCLSPKEGESTIQDSPPLLKNIENVNDVDPDTLPQLIHMPQVQENSMVSVENSDTNGLLIVGSHPETATAKCSTIMMLTENDDECSDFSDGYEESDSVGVGPVGSVEDESVCMKQETLESDSLPSNEDMHSVSDKSSRLANSYSILGYDKNLHILDVQEFQCKNETSTCSVKVLEVDARELTEQGFIDVFVIKNEKPPSPSTLRKVEGIESFDNILNATIKQECLEPSSPHDGNEIFILENEGIIPASRSKMITKKDRTMKSLRCTICGRCFESRESLYHHKKTMHIKSNNRFKCQLCMNTYMTWSYLKKHHQRVHYNREKARFKCSYCPEAFPQRHMLRMHVKKHTGQKDHVCDVCNKRFAELFVLNAHRKLVHFPEKLYECVECQKKYKSCAGLKKHMFSHNAEKKYACHCGKTFSNPESLLHHEKLHSDERPFACDQCSKAFVMRATLKKHIKRVHENVKRIDITKKPYVCDCGKRFAVESYLTNHIACYHADFKPHVCHLCQKQFSKRFMLNKHVKKDHPGSIPQKDNNVPKQTVPCETCGKKFISVYHLNRHMKRFHPSEDKSSDLESEKPSTFVCHCGKEFSQERYLKCHLIVHDQLRPFTCDVCDKTFSKLFKLNKHIKHVHMKKAKPVDPNKSFVCECGKRFSNKRNLACHEITHKPRTEFKCPVCGKDFGAKYLLNKHLRRVHEEDPNDYSEHFK
ncbi:zinc finger protein 569-like [Gigantopelta aegis]|uniref:zinc finger protein 569-like n=1 Tax=Gigantopelta aegis TaxID=1735272 RepID=UPI001B887B64|nr:zinc finger protein 569-like [Gigantopelta aegis]